MPNARMFEAFAQGLDDDMDEDEVGASFAQMLKLAKNKGAARRGPTGGRPRLAPPPVINTMPAGLSMKRIPLGIGTVTFALSTGTSLTAEVEPQRGYTPQRLVASVTRTGTTSTGSIKVTSIKHGDTEQLPSSNGCPVAMFAADTTDAELDLTPVTPGMKIIVTVSCSVAVTGTDSIVVDLGYYGQAVGQ